MLLCGLTANAHDFEVDGIYYNITSFQDFTVEVTFKGEKYNSFSNEYSKEVRIPNQIAYSGKTYSVTSIGSYAFYECSGLTSVSIPSGITSICNNAFNGCSGLVRVSIPYSVTLIEAYAFRKCTKITSISISGETKIGYGAFRNCSNLSSINISNKVKMIDEEAFNNTAWYNNQSEGVLYLSDWIIGYKGATEDLTAIEIADGTVGIASGAFRDCDFISAVTIPESVRVIGMAAFANCCNLSSVTVSSDMDNIGSGAFMNTQWFNHQSDGFVYIGNILYACKGKIPSDEEIREGTVGIADGAFHGTTIGPAINIPQSVKTIGESAFSSCFGLGSVTLSNGIVSIGDNAFSYCEGLHSINFPKSLKSIGKQAFTGCRLSIIAIPESVISIGDEAFSGCWKVDSIIVEEGNAVYDSRNRCNAIIRIKDNTLIRGCSNTIIPQSVTAIANKAFDLSFQGYIGNRKLRSVTIPESVKMIGNNAFSGCDLICSITMPEVLEHIGNRAFSGCSNLTSIIVPKNLLGIGSHAFDGCNNLLKVINLSELDIQKGSIDNGYVGYYAQIVVKADDFVEEYCFHTTEEGVHNLCYYMGKERKLVLPENYKGEDYEIEEGAFKDNDSIVSVTIPQTVGTVGKSAFAECSNLEEVTLARGVMSIEDNAFENCTSLATIVIPQNMKTIGNSAFAGCMGLVSVSFKEGIETIGNNAFENCASITSILFPESLTAIGEKAFSGCSGLTSLSCSANIETYGEGAFEGCAEVETLMVMGSVMPTVPSNKLTSITLFSPRPLETEPFANKVYRNATLYVPEGSLSRYQSADVWEDFWNIKEFDPTGIADVTVDEDADAPIYNMKGVRVNGTRSTLPAGLYIQNGKKFVVM